jgi:hypothetical protein
MNARAYFQILRPGRTLGVTLLYGTFVWGWLRFLFRASPSESLFFTFAVVVPVLLGSLLLGPLHEVMHRSFFPTLPGARRSLQRWHLRGVAIASILLGIPAAIFVKAIPGVALYGLIVAGLSLPVLNSRRRIWGTIRPQFLLLILAGIVLTLTTRSTLAAACQHAPWAVLVGGLGFAWVCFRIGFSAPRVRDRWRDPLLFCSQSMIPFVGSDIILYAQAQGQQFAKEQNTSRGCDWKVTSVGSSPFDWVRVLHHARYGRVSRVRSLLGLVVVGAMFTPIAIVAAYLMARDVDTPSSVTLFCQHLVDAGSIDGNKKYFPAFFALAMPPIFFCFGVLSLIMVASAPVGRFPISRDRLARFLYIETLRKAGGLFAVYIASTALCLLIAGHVAGQPLAVDILMKPLAATLFIPPATALALALLLHVQRALWHVLATIVVYFGFLIGEFAVLLKFTPLLLSPPGLLGWIAVTCGAGWLCWLAFRGYYRTCDLNRPSLGAKIHGTGAAPKNVPIPEPPCPPLPPTPPLRSS